MQSLAEFFNFKAEKSTIPAQLGILNPQFFDNEKFWTLVNQNHPVLIQSIEQAARASINRKHGTATCLDLPDVHFSYIEFLVDELHKIDAGLTAKIAPFIRDAHIPENDKKQKILKFVNAILDENPWNIRELKSAPIVPEDSKCFELKFLGFIEPVLEAHADETAKDAEEAAKDDEKENVLENDLSYSSSLTLLNGLFMVGGAVAIVAGLAVLMALNLIALGTVLAGVGLVSLSVGLGLFFSRPSAPKPDAPVFEADDDLHAALQPN